MNTRSATMLHGAAWRLFAGLEAPPGLLFCDGYAEKLITRWGGSALAVGPSRKDS